MNRLWIGEDGKTTYERLKGKKPYILGVEFGEKFWYMKKGGKHWTNYDHVGDKESLLECGARAIRPWWRPSLALSSAGAYGGYQWRPDGALIASVGWSMRHGGCASVMMEPTEICLRDYQPKRNARPRIKPHKLSRAR